MARIEFERVSPDKVGIPPTSFEWLLDKLEEGWTEPHGLMVMKDDKIIAEGWWAPYAPGIAHGLQSHTKTYAATAIGIAIREGLLHLEDRVIDIFPDKAPAEPSENLKLLTVRDVLCMGCGMETMPSNDDPEWIRAFLATPVIHKPGTAFMYNSTGSTLLAAMIKEKTGQGMIEYLTPRLFDKIGIDADNLKCSCMADGIEIGGGGLYATTEDNLRLMKLYQDGGVWDGERILDEDFVKKATSLQNESATERAVNPPAEDNFVGYGFQIWMCRREGVYRADGAMGQFTIVFPKYNMILAITENASGATGGAVPQKVLDTIWQWYDHLPEPEEGWHDDAKAAEHIRRRMSMLSLPTPRYSKSSPQQEAFAGTYKLQEGKLAFKVPDFFARATDAQDIETLTIAFPENRAVFTAIDKGGQEKILEAAMDGSRKENVVYGLAGRALVSAEWAAENDLEVKIRLVETCYEVQIDFHFADGNLLTESGSSRSFMPDRKDRAVFIRQA